MTASRRLHVHVLAALSGAAVVSGCGTDDSPAAAPTMTPPAESMNTSVRPSPSAVSSSPVVHTIAIRVASGKVMSGGGRIRVPRGTPVRITVTSDSADEVHVHGYNEDVLVAAGGTAVLEFRASIPGIFEVELHHQDLRLVSLIVS